MNIQEMNTGEQQQMPRYLSCQFMEFLKHPAFISTTSLFPRGSAPDPGRFLDAQESRRKEAPS
jgi:hypothetical protein